MRRQYILAHDLGTSGDKAILYNFEGALCESFVQAYDAFYPGVNMVEQDPEDWWKAVCASTKNLMEKANIKAEEICCITFSAQMSGCLPVDNSGKPLRKSLIWADLRSVREADFIEKILGMKRVYEITGHRVSPSYPSAKLLWIKENEKDIYDKTYKILNAKDYIVFKLTGVFATDFSDASGTGLLDINKKEWSDEIISAVDVDKSMLPDILASTDMAGKITREASKEIGLLEGTPVVMGGGDGCCAAVGAGAVEEGTIYSCLGSSAWISLASKKPILDDKMTNFNFIHLDKNLYAPCGTMQSGGYSYKWLKDTICGLEAQEAESKNISSYEVINKLIDASSPGAKNLLFLPYLLGERSPRWNPEAKGAFVGLNITHSKEDIYRSVLEGVAFNLKVILDIFNREIDCSNVIAIGGGAKGQTWLQILADIWQKTILVPSSIEEATSMGAAVCGGVGIKAFQDFNVIKKFNKIERIVSPREEYKEKYDKLYEVFNEAYYSLTHVYEKLSNI